MLMAHMELLKTRSWPSIQEPGPVSSWRELIAVLLNIAPDEQLVIKTLIKLTMIRNATFGTFTVRVAAVSGLGEIGRLYPDKRKQIVPALIAALDIQDEGASLFGGPGSGIGGIGKDRPRRHDQQTCRAAIEALKGFGPDAKEAVPALKKLKLNPEMMIREAAIAALEKIEKPE